MPKVVNFYNLLEHNDEEDKSTNNLSRKLAKKKRMFEIKPTEKLKNEIIKLESIVNPPKTVKKVKVKKEKVKSDKQIHKEKMNNIKFKLREEKRKEKAEKEKIERELYRKNELKIQEKRKEYIMRKKQNELISEQKYDLLINLYIDKELLNECKLNKLKNVAITIILSLYYIGYPPDVVSVILKYIKHDIFSNNYLKLLNNDIIQYIKKKYKNKTTEKKLKLKYHPDKNNGKTNQLYIFINNIISEKLEIIN